MNYMTKIGRKISLDGPAPIALVLWWSNRSYTHIE